VALLDDVGGRRPPLQMRCCGSRSIEIRLRERKCVSDYLDTRLRIVCDDYFHNVEAKKNIRIVEHSQPRECAARYSFPFVPINGRNRPSEIFARTCFYFNEHKSVVIATNNIDLAPAASAEIAEQDLVTATLQISAR
jgi:hypothetical protein